MSNEELVELYQSGNNKALDRLIQANTGMVFKIANKFYTGNTNSIDIEDLEQEGYIGLMIAANKYRADLENSASFITYAVYYIYQRMNRFIRSKNTNDETSLNIPTNTYDDIELMDNIESIDYSFENIEEKIYIEQLRNELEQAMNENNTLFEREILKLRYGWDNNRVCSQNEIADIFDTYQNKIASNEVKALRKLRNSTWGQEKKKEYIHDKLYAIVEGSRFNQDKAIDTMDILDKYFKGVV